MDGWLVGIPREPLTGRWLTLKGILAHIDIQKLNGSVLNVVYGFFFLKGLYLFRLSGKKIAHEQHSISPYFLPTCSYFSVPNTSQISQHFSPTRPLTRQAASCWYSLGQVRFGSHKPKPQVSEVSITETQSHVRAAFLGPELRWKLQFSTLLSSWNLSKQTTVTTWRRIIFSSYPKSLLFTNRKRGSSVKWCYFKDQKRKEANEKNRLPSCHLPPGYPTLVHHQASRCIKLWFQLKGLWHQRILSQMAHPSGSRSIMYDDHLWLSSQPIHSEAKSWDFPIQTANQIRNLHIHDNWSTGTRPANACEWQSTTRTTFQISHWTWSEVATAFQGLMLRWQAADGLTCCPWCLPSHPARLRWIKEKKWRLWLQLQKWKITLSQSCCFFLEPSFVSSSLVTGHFPELSICFSMSLRIHAATYLRSLHQETTSRAKIRNPRRLQMITSSVICRSSYHQGTPSHRHVWF